MYTTNIETQLKKNKDISQNKFDDLKIDLYDDFDLNIIDGNNLLVEFELCYYNDKSVRLKQIIIY